MKDLTTTPRGALHLDDNVHEATSTFPTTTDRAQVIALAVSALESGTATPPDGQDPQSMADMLKTAHGRGGLGAFAAYKTAQRINAQAVTA